MAPGPGPRPRPSPAAVLLVGLLCAAGASPTARAAAGAGAPPAAGAMEEALEAPTEAGRVEGLVRVLTGEDLPAALEAADALAGLGPSVVPRLASEMRRAPNNWLIGATLVRMGSDAVGPLVELLDGAPEATAVDCLYLLGEIRDRRAVPTLIRSLEDPREKVRRYAVTSLLQIGGPRAVEAVLSRLTREGKELEGFIVESVLRYGQESVAPVIQSLLSPDARVRREAAFLLGGMGDARAADPLVRVLGDPEAEVRRNAAYALGRLAGRLESPGEAAGSLVSLLADPVPEVVEAARGALVRCGEPAVPFLVAAAREGPATRSVASLNALREIGSPRAEAVMVDLLRHPERRVRVAAAAGLVTSGTGRSVEPLLDALRDDDLRWFATLALENVGAADPKLFFSASPDDPTMQLRTQILVRLGEAVVPALTELLRDSRPGRQATCLWILGQIGDPRSARDVAGFLGDAQLGWLAGRALADMGEAGLAELLRYAASPPSDRGALEAVQALGLFDDPRAWDALEGAVAGGVPRVARVRAAVLLLERGDGGRGARVRRYLDGEGRALRPDVEAALRSARGGP